MSDDSDCCEIIETPLESRTNSLKKAAKPQQHSPNRSARKVAPVDIPCNSPTNDSNTLLLSQTSDGVSSYGGKQCNSSSTKPEADEVYGRSDDVESSLWVQNAGAGLDTTRDVGDMGGGAEDDLADNDQSEEEAANPFASFAFGGETPTAIIMAGNKRKAGEYSRVSSSARGLGHAESGLKSEDSDRPSQKKMRHEPQDHYQIRARGRGEKKGCVNAEDIASMSADDLQGLRAKWRAMADRQASDEDQRFQVLVGAVLSSRAQATVVTEGLERLRATEGGLKVSTMAAIEQGELASILRSVHYNKAKSKYIREGAALILRRHGGKVPRRKGDILALPGVGPALGEILVKVFGAWEAENDAEAEVELKCTIGSLDQPENPINPKRIGGSTDVKGGDNHKKTSTASHTSTAAKKIKKFEAGDGKRTGFL